jgi:hypothetical protein
MPYIRNIASRVNGADACGGGMKKQGLVYGSDHARIKGNYLARNTALPKNFVFRNKILSDCNPVKAVNTYVKVRLTLTN